MVEQAKKFSAVVEVEVKLLLMVVFSNMILRGCINSSTNSFGYLKGSLAGVTGVVKKFPTN